MDRKGYNRIEEIIMFGIEYIKCDIKNIKEDLQRFIDRIKLIESAHRPYKYINGRVHMVDIHNDIDERLVKMEQFISDMGYEYKPESTTPAKWVKKSNPAKK